MLLINHIFQPEVIKTISQNYIHLEHNDNIYIFSLSQNSAVFIDKEENYWIYTNNNITLSDINNQEKQLQVGDIVSFDDGTTYKRVHSLYEVDNIAKEYFMPFVKLHTDAISNNTIYNFSIN
ncbi:MAG: hypothetical protein QM535_09775 [Limnohabitans sp.]|nr:hypothetical protein [Limnohabitans sp.]